MSHILIVEDDRLNVLVFKKILQKHGQFEVTNTENVEQALDMCRKQIVDLVIMDISLDNSSYKGDFIDGLEITRMLKNDEETSNIPVILTTAHAMRGDGDRFIEESGADGYVPKPIVDHSQFVDMIKAKIAAKNEK